MWMYKRIKVALHERALVFRDRNFERVLAPGKYWLWGRDLEVQVYDVSQPELALPRADVLIAEARAALVRQVSSPVRWRESLELLAREGVDTFVEVGPGKVLSGLVRQTAPQARGLNVEDAASLEAAREALAEGGQQAAAGD
jgi:[acyl-carrier-protein] S-malonyltransferase